MIRIIPDLGRIKAHWSHRSSEIPDYLMVPMSDGSVVRYNPEVVQPGFVKAMDVLKNICVGYEPGRMTSKKENDNESTI